MKSLFFLLLAIFLNSYSGNSNFLIFTKQAHDKSIHKERHIYIPPPPALKVKNPNF